MKFPISISFRHLILVRKCCSKPICPPVQCEDGEPFAIIEYCSETPICNNPTGEEHFSDITSRMICDRPEPLGPGACKCGEYKNTEYYSYHKYSFENGQMDLQCKRAHPQPNPNRKP